MVKNETFDAKNSVKNDEDAKEAAFCERLAYLANEHTVRGMERRLDIPNPNIRRYIKKGLPAASFCRRLVERMGVNPAWLLTGEGSPMLSDVPAATSGAASDLLELVQAMSAVTRVRLGALAGKQHARVLRELNDALSQYEDLRKKLNDYSSSIFKELIEDLSKVLVKQANVEQAAHLIKAGDQVMRLCDDIGLQTKFLELRSWYERLAGKSRDATRTLQEAVFRSFIRGDGEQMGGRSINGMVDLSSLLYQQYRPDEARTFIEAALLFASRLEHNSPPRLNALEFAAVLDFEHGKIHQVRERLAYVCSRAGEEQRERSTLPYIVNLDYFVGVTTYEQARYLFGKTRPPHDLLASSIVIWSEREEHLADHVKAIEKYRGPTNYFMAVGAAYVSALFQAVRKQSVKAILETFERNIAASSRSDDIDLMMQLSAPVFRAHIASLGGDNDIALQHTLAAESAFESRGPDVKPRLRVAAVHYRNILRCAAAPTELRTKARAFFDKHIAAGYAVFRSALEPAKKSSARHKGE